MDAVARRRRIPYILSPPHRIAWRLHVHRTLGRPAEHPPLASEDHDDVGGRGRRGNIGEALGRSDEQERHPLLQANGVAVAIRCAFRDADPGVLLLH